MSEEDIARMIANDYLQALVKSRRAVDRILSCVADVAEKDAACAREIAAHPEALAALSRSVRPADWLLEQAGVRPLPRAAVSSAPRRAAKPYLTSGRIGKPRRRKQ